MPKVRAMTLNYTARMACRCALLAIVALLTGCSFGLRQPAPVKNYYLIETIAQASTQPPLYPFAVKVSNIEVAPPYSDRGLVYRLDEQRYDADFYNQFFSTPRAMIMTQVTQWLGQRQIFAAVLNPASALDAPYLLEGLVTQLYADVRPGTQPSSVLAMQLFLTRVSDRAIVLDRTYTRTVFVPNQNAASIVKGMSEALEQCLSELERDLRALNLGP
jgi:ABC-type uncharacterized transport system auxiliary subunit